jgi:5-methyltetrahydrofolate--homocysteine methyltransferase
VGELYEKQVIFLPQLISSANAATAAFDMIKERIQAKGDGSVSNGTIVICTVKGDIHDIGKNIVKVILENYGYKMIDLGRDVPVEKVVEATKESGAKLVGLSALMTTTLPAMEETIQAVHRECPGVQVFVGGAVLTPEYAMKMGADYYSKDARESVDVAKKVFGQ